MGLFEVSGLWVLAIGKAIVHSIWIGLLLLALLRLVLAFIPEKLSGLRYSISVSTLLLLFTSVLATFLLLYEPVSPIRESLIIQGSSVKDSIPGANQLFVLFGYIYFAGLLFMLCRSMASVAHIRELRKSCNQVSSRWLQHLRQISLSMGVTPSVDFLESNRVKAPLLVGYLKPAVIVPAGMFTNLPVNQIETIILHELYHLLRRDYLVNIMQVVIEGVLFYHPVVWIISGFIRSEREHCCDDSVLKITGNPVAYAKALIHIAEQKYYSRLTPGAVGSGKGQFESRIRRILNQNSMKTNMRDKILTLTLLAGSLIIMLTFSGFSTGPPNIHVRKAHAAVIDESGFPAEFTFPDTIPEKKHQAELEKLDEIEWEAIKEELEAARKDALAAIEEMDWEAMKEEMELSLSDMKLDMEEIKIDIENSMQDIDWEAMKEEMDLNLSDMKLDMEKIKIDIENSMKDIDWDEIEKDIRENLENSKQCLDSIKIEMDL